MTGKRVSCKLISNILGNGGNKKCVSVDNETSIAIEGYKTFNFDYVADEEV
jgi:hypothetical protein